MSGTDPKGRWFSKGDPTQPFKPEGANDPAPGQQPEGLPKIPGITLAYEIARGGMGVVYAGRQDFLDRRVAVKFLSVELGGQSFVQRFQREAKILAGIKHPNIVACHMADTTEDGQSYLVMEFIDGPSLKAWIQDNGPVSPMASLRLVRASAQALAHAHQSDIIHRDVKPENILLETLTSTSIDVAFPFTPKLVDLGLARMTHESVGMGLTSPGSVMGTPSTMSPEQFDDPDSVDFRSDIYGLGCCLYEMLTGHPAFRGNKLTDIVTKKREAIGPNPCDENPQVPAAVGALCQRLLASDRNDRPASYKELDKVLEELMMALVTSRQRQRTDTIVDMPQGDEDGGATMVSAPRPGAATRKDEPTLPAKGKTAPGMLNTGEFDFLAAGGDAGGKGPTQPAFSDGSSDTRPTTASGDTAPNRTPLYVGIGAVALLAAGVGVWMGTRGGDEPGTGGGGNGGGNANGNRPPVVASIEGPATVARGDRFTLAADASDAEGDKLEYQWKWPAAAIVPMSDTRRASADFRLENGLPGLEFTVKVVVSDADHPDGVTREHTVVVGDYPAERPLIGFKGKPEWRFDPTQKLKWTDVVDPRDQHVSGRTRKDELIKLSTDLGSDRYWQWSGTLSSEEGEAGYATLGVRFAFGDRAYAVRCDRAEDGALWSVEVVECLGEQDGWQCRSLPKPCRAEWRQPDGTLDDYRAWFSVERRDDKLVLQVGETRLPAPSDKDPEPQELPPRKQPAVELPIPSGVDEGELTLVVEHGIGRFRLTRR